MKGKISFSHGIDFFISINKRLIAPHDLFWCWWVVKHHSFKTWILHVFLSVEYSCSTISWTKNISWQRRVFLGVQANCERYAFGSFSFISLNFLIFSRSGSIYLSKKLYQLKTPDNAICLGHSSISHQCFSQSCLNAIMLFNKLNDIVAMSWLDGMQQHCYVLKILNFNN